MVVRAKKSALSSHKRTLPMCPEATEEDKRTFVIVGGGEADKSSHRYKLINFFLIRVLIEPEFR